MATLYVSQTATNGFGVGDDSRNAATAADKSTPLLTIESAISKATAADSIIINDGTYTHATFFADTKGLTFLPYNDLMVTLKQGGGQARVLNKATTGNTTLGALILDVEGGAQSLSVSSTASLSTLTLNGTVLTGAATYGLRNDSAILNIVARDATITGARDAIYNPVAFTSGSMILERCVLISTAHAGSGFGVVSMTASATGVTAQIRDCVMRLTGSVSSISCAKLNNVVALIERNRMYVSGTSGLASGVHIGSTSATLAQGSVVRWNYINHQSTDGAAAGYLVLVGSDTTQGSGAYDDMVNYPVVYGNFGTGKPGGTPGLHGFMLGWNKGGCVTGNVALHTAIPFLTKSQSERSYWVNNLASQGLASTSGMLRSKGSTNPLFAGNTAVTDAISENYAMVADEDPTPAVATTGGMFLANNIDANWAATKLAYVETDSDAVFLFNNYDALSVSGTPFTYGASTYATVALWLAAVEPTAQTFFAETFDREFRNKVGMSAGPRSLPRTGIMPRWGA